MLHTPVATNRRAPATATVRPSDPRQRLHPFASRNVNPYSAADFPALSLAALSHPQPGSAGVTTGRMAPVAALQRKCECGGGPDCDCDTGEKEHHGGLHRAATGTSRQPPLQAPAIVHEVLHSPGQPLDSGPRAFFEARFGRDLSGVRVHTDSRAADSACAVRALGYTVGQHIAFAAGQYQPGSESGRRLLAHELAHTFQQHGTTLDSGPLSVAPATGPDEQLADRMAGHALAGPAFEPFSRHAANLGAGVSPAAVARTSSGARLQRQVQVTCSVDAIKIARAKAGDKSAAAEIVNCCQSGLSPLPAGCTNDLIDALTKILGKKPGDKTKCPPGFHGGKTKDYADQCCKDSAAAESKQDCCPAERISPMFGTCCPEGQLPQGNKCGPPPSGTSLLDACPKEWRTPFGLKCCPPPLLPGSFDCVQPGTGPKQ